MAVLYGRLGERFFGKTPVGEKYYWSCIWNRAMLRIFADALDERKKEQIRALTGSIPVDNIKMSKHVDELCDDLKCLNLDNIDENLEIYFHNDDLCFDVKFLFIPWGFSIKIEAKCRTLSIENCVSEGGAIIDIIGNYIRYIEINNTKISKGIYLQVYQNNESDRTLNSSNDGNLITLDFKQNNVTNLVRFAGFDFSSARFNKSRMGQIIIAPGTEIRHDFDFSETEVCLSAQFRGCEFDGFTNFERAKIHGTLDLSNCVFKSKTNFSLMNFNFENSYPPNLISAKLNDDTNFNLIKWPPPPATVESAIEFRRRYEWIRHYFNSRQNHHDEKDIARYENRCREIEEGYSPVGVARRLYRWTSDSGWSIARPAAYLLAIWLVGWVLIGLNQAVSNHYMPSGQAAAFSFSNMFSFLGFGRTYFDVIADDLTTFSKVVAGCQTVFSPIFLFLLLLGLRNRFRMQ